MAKRMILMLAITATLIGALGFAKFRQIQEGMAQAAAFQPPPEAVTTIVAKQLKWPDTLNAIGTIAAVQGVTVSADLPGIVERIDFESGASVHAGDILVQLDSKQEQAQLAAVESDRDLARLNFERLKDLVQEGAISRADYDRAAAEQRQTEAKVGEVRAAIERKTIRAPFSGILGIRQVNLGQYLSAGDAVVPLQSLDPIYVNFSVPQQDAERTPVGRNVRITTADSTDLEFAGQVTAINSVVDEVTRNVQVQATLANPQNKLRPGMFVQTEVDLGMSHPIVPVPASAVNYAPYGDSVFVVANLQNQNGQTYRGVRQQVVKLGPSRGDQISIVSGVKSGEEVVTSGVFKLRNGAAVLVNNKNQPGNNPAPKVENN
ncbi:MAG TPA: efflux RND transporter periplasmic adaptor subunit [Terriglobia bacterium]|nr:efflux RND transporter periplasmic adaptor subunit [Terriglobia bacterium]